jgi:hypothetical protein
VLAEDDNARRAFLEKGLAGEGACAALALE